MITSDIVSYRINNDKFLLRIYRMHNLLYYKNYLS